MNIFIEEMSKRNGGKMSLLDKIFLISMVLFVPSFIICKINEDKNDTIFTVTGYITVISGLSVMVCTFIHDLF